MDTTQEGSENVDSHSHDLCGYIFSFIVLEGCKYEICCHSEVSSVIKW